MKESLNFCRRDFLKDVALGTAALFLWGVIFQAVSIY